MKAIFKRELNSYFTSLLGYVFLTIFLLLTGAMFSLVNIFQYQTANMTYFFASINNIAVFFLPLLTMRLFSEDRKLKTDQLLMTAPVSVGDIVLSKFFAAFAVLLAGTAVTLIYPICLSFFGELPIAETISCYIGFILLCSVILSIGAFMSSVTESQIVAAVATYGVIILILLLGTAAQYISNELIASSLLWLSPIQRFSEFTLGILNFEPIIYYLSLTGLFLFLTMMVFEKRRLR